MQSSVLIFSERTEGRDLLPVLHRTEYHLTLFLKEFGPSRALDFLLFMWTTSPSCSQPLYRARSQGQTFTPSCTEQLYYIECKSFSSLSPFYWLTLCPLATREWFLDAFLHITHYFVFCILFLISTDRWCHSAVLAACPSRRPTTVLDRQWVMSQQDLTWPGAWRKEAGSSHGRFSRTLSGINAIYGLTTWALSQKLATLGHEDDGKPESYPRINTVHFQILVSSQWGKSGKLL